MFKDHRDNRPEKCTVRSDVRVSGTGQNLAPLALSLNTAARGIGGPRSLYTRGSSIPMVAVWVSKTLNRQLSYHVSDFAQRQ